jgi:hypothetical protein
MPEGTPPGVRSGLAIDHPAIQPENNSIINSPGKIPAIISFTSETSAATA